MLYAIETEGLTKVFHKNWTKQEFRAVDGISLHVEPGTTYGLLGPNGAGKTTFVKMLLSCSHPTAGNAKVFGMDTRNPEARQPIGYLPENHRFPTYMTGRGMLDFYGALSGMDSAARKRRIPELLELVGLAQWGGTRLGKYSKGMLQRVGLAQALMHEPKLLVLDEPSDGVDPVGRRQIRDILEALEKKGVTIFLNSHLLVEVELFCRHHQSRPPRARRFREGPHRGERLPGGSGDGARSTGYGVARRREKLNPERWQVGGALRRSRIGQSRARSSPRATMSDREVRPREQYARRCFHQDGRCQIRLEFKPARWLWTLSAKHSPAKSFGAFSAAPRR
jgi:ABC-type Na+ transport system ATPase subunit NatA